MDRMQILYIYIYNIYIYGDCVISCKDVEQAINKRNPGKNNGNNGLKTNHFISAENDLSEMYHYFCLDCLRMVQFHKSCYYVQLF